MAVFVTDGNQRATLAVVRALGHAGIPVTVGECHPRSLAGQSRFCSKAICYPSPVTDGDRFLEFLNHELLNGGYSVVIPMTDITARLVTAFGESLPPTVRLPFPGADRVMETQDKGHVLRLAQRLSVPCPESYVLEAGDDPECLVEKVRFPAVVKPRFSRFLCHGQWISEPVQYVHDRPNLIAGLKRIHSRIPNPLVQEKLEGEGRGVFLLIWNNELKAAFCHRRLREKPPSGGVSVYSESLPLDQDLVEKSFVLLKELSWQGVAMVEFKVDQRNGMAKLMEVNGRFWGSLQLAVDAGINFPLMLYQLSVGQNVRPRFDYEVGVKSRWLLGDCDHLWIQLKNPYGSLGCGVSRFRSILRFLKLYERNMRYDVMRLDDVSPGWFELKEYLLHSFRKGHS